MSFENAMGKEVELNDLPPCLQSESATPLAEIGLVLPSKGVNLRQIEKELFREALKKNHGNRSRAARYLGITRDALNYRMRKHGLDPATVRRVGRNRVEQSPITVLVH